jgi:ribonucleoside-diphosphate reductase alpha chain
MGPTLPLSIRTHREKYRGEGEGFKETGNRIANALKDDEVFYKDKDHYHTFREIYHDMRFLPAGRVQAAMGSLKKVTAINCFVMATIADSFHEGEGNIMQIATEAAKTMRMGGGVGYDFSSLRPRGELIRSLQSRASGPVSFMEIFDAVCRTIASAGHRRGAQMGVLRCDHPDIEEFIHVKNEKGRLTGFNVSVAITDEFMNAVVTDSEFDLKWNGRVYKTISAKGLWETIMRSTWSYAEPGVLFIDRINEMNNLYYCETIAATNPCGEQPLPPHGACLLGSFNLVRYIRVKKVHSDLDVKEYRFDWAQLRKDIPPVVRAMDNVTDRTSYPLKEQAAEAKAKRRMGLGVAGLANAGEALGYPYGSKSFIQFERRVLRTVLELSYQTSALLAKEKGSFPLYNKSKYLKGKFVSEVLSQKTRDMIAKHGIRNSHLTSIAPTGTISLTADNITSGIEPVFANSIERMVIGVNGPELERLTDYGYREFGIQGRTSSECSADDHVAVLIEASKWVDSAVSKTCNVSPDMPWDDFKAIYFKAWKGGCKGCTTFNSGGERGGIMNAEEDGEACFIDPATGERSCD